MDTVDEVLLRLAIEVTGLRKHVEVLSRENAELRMELGKCRSDKSDD